MNNWQFNRRSALRLATLLSVTLAGCSSETASNQASVVDFNSPKSVATLFARNPNDFARSDQSFVFSFSELGINPHKAPLLTITDGENKLASQVIDTDADGNPDSLFFVTDFNRYEQKKFKIQKTEKPTATPFITQAEIAHKVGGGWNGKVYEGSTFRNVTSLKPPTQYTDHSYWIRYEGPGIESDKVGYRVYLDWRNGFDVFGKLTDQPTLHNIGLDGYDSYHHPASWGMDILKVGKSLGMGGYGAWLNNKVERVSDTRTRSVDIIESKGIYSSLKITYEDWRFGKQQTDLSALLSMQKGSYWVTTELTTEPSVKELVAGIGKHENAELIVGNFDVTGEEWTYIATLGPQSLSGEEDQLAKAILFQKRDLKQLAEDEHNHVVRLKTRNGKVQYKFAALWQPTAGDAVASKEQLHAFLQQEADKLTFAPRISLQTTKTNAQKSHARGSEYALYWAQRLAASEIARRGDSLAYGGFDEINGKPAVWAYTTGLLSQAIDLIGRDTANIDMQNFSKANIDSYLETNGTIKTYVKDKFNIDKINSGKMLLEYYSRSKEDKYRLAASVLRDQLNDHPRTTDGAFWHKKRYPGQLWLDGVYMSIPFLVDYSVRFENSVSLKEALHEFEQTRAVLRDPKTGLYFHAWDELKQQNWADKATGRSGLFWARGMGWLAMALVDTLDFIPETETEKRQQLILQTQELAKALVAVRNDNGTWSQILASDQADAANYDEASATAMFTYMLAKGVNKGYLDSHYKVIAEESYGAIVRDFIEVHSDNSVSLSGICQVAGLGFGRDGSYRYYQSEPIVNNDPKGFAPFLMASHEISQFTPQKFIK